MFVTNKTFEYWRKSFERDFDRISSRYLELWGKHERLLRHLNLDEVPIPAKVELRTKGGPEQP